MPRNKGLLLLLFYTPGECRPTIIKVVTMSTKVKYNIVKVIQYADEVGSL